MSGTTQVAWPDKPVAAEADWPMGMLELVNDPLRVSGWNPWFSEWPNDVNHYEFKPGTSNEVNHLLARLASIQAEPVCLVLSPEAEPRGLGFTTVLAKSNRVAAVFAIGNQKRLDDWFARLPETSPGVRKFGVQVLAEAPKALPPTLTLYVGNAAVDLKSLRVPANVEVSAAPSSPTGKDAISEARSQVIAAFLAARPLQGAARKPRRRGVRPRFTNRLHERGATPLHSLWQAPLFQPRDHQQP